MSLWVVKTTDVEYAQMVYDLVNNPKKLHCGAQLCALCATFGSVQVLQPPQSHTASSAPACEPYQLQHCDLCDIGIAVTSG